MPDQSADNKPKRVPSTTGQSADTPQSSSVRTDIPGTKVVILAVTESADGQRLDNYLLSRLKGAPRSLIYRIIRRGEVRVNGGRAKADRRLLEGDKVRIPPVRLAEPGAPPVVSRATRQATDQPLFEDEHLLVVDKPSGLAVHAGTALSSGIVEQLRQHRPQDTFLELAHRLDRETSGCLVLAKNRQTLLGMHEQFRQSDAAGLAKRYVALMRHVDDSAAPVGREIVVDQALTDSRNQHQQAVTVFRPRHHYAGASLMDIDTHTGRKHQIRRHALLLKMPVAGDDRYGDFAFNRRLRKQKLRRLFLHAAEIRFQHPVSGRTIEIEAPLPTELAICLKNLGE